MSSAILIRGVTPRDYAEWRPLWNGYNAFYGRSGETAVPEAVTAVIWARFLDPAEPVFALVAEQDGRLVGMTHYLFHRSTTKVEDVCYLRDLFTVDNLRGKGIGRKLIAGVAAAARAAGSTRVYWQTHTTNEAGRLLYDKVAKHQGFIVYDLQM
jgi:GNAT superfamily N-acetyltransferase